MVQCPVQEDMGFVKFAKNTGRVCGVPSNPESWEVLASPLVVGMFKLEHLGVSV